LDVCTSHSYCLSMMEWFLKAFQCLKTSLSSAWFTLSLNDYIPIYSFHADMLVWVSLHARWVSAILYRWPY